MDNQAEVDDNVRVDHMAGREEDVEHLNHVHGEKEENVTTSNNPNLRNYQLARDRERREIRAPHWFGHTDMVSFTFYSTQGLEFKEPSSYEKLITCSDSKKWNITMHEEFDEVS